MFLGPWTSDVDNAIMMHFVDSSPMPKRSQKDDAPYNSRRGNLIHPE